VSLGRRSSFASTPCSEGRDAGDLFVAALTADHFRFAMFAVEERPHEPT